MSYPPPQQAFPSAPPQPGYPPPQQSYPPPQQNYPPPQGQPLPQQGYPSPQGQPPPQQGYPPQQAPPLPTKPGSLPPEQPHPLQPPPQLGQPAASTSSPAANTALPGGADDGTKTDPDLDDPKETDLLPANMDPVAGYDMMDIVLPPPPPTYEEAVAQPERDFTAEMPKLEEEEARKALLALVEEKTCWGRDAADDLIFKNIEHTAAFHYILETYTESRSTKWVYEPYVDQIIDGPMNGPAPAPWNIPVEMPTMFRNAVQHVEVPHTASVKPCHNCRGSGYRQCVRCSGRGTTMCSWCGGDGWRIVSRYDGDHSYTDHEICYSCGGDGRKRCSPCDGSGRVMCRTCTGQGQLKCYIRLTVEWKNHMEDYIFERTALPDELIRNVTGKTVFDEESPKVWPIKHFPVAEVNSGSERLLQRHAHAYSQERLHRQRHQIRVTPVVELQCQYEDESFTYFVYGFENKVYAPDYPMQCCWGCSIL